MGVFSKITFVDLDTGEQTSYLIKAKSIQTRKVGKCSKEDKKALSNNNEKLKKDRSKCSEKKKVVKAFVNKMREKVAKLKKNIEAIRLKIKEIKQRTPKPRPTR